MSYCRFSDNDFQCDVYAYDDCMGGITTHIASNRREYKEPLPPSVSIFDTEAFMARYATVERMLEEADRIPLELPYAGEQFNDPDLESFLARLEELRDLGYWIPAHVFDAVKAELTQMPE